jgi:putative membrane protein
MDQKIVAKAEFSPLVIKYIFLSVLFYLFLMVIGWIAIPFWLFGWGKWASRRYFENLECYITEKNLEYRKGHMFRTEKTIPLDKIQDLTFKQGPLLRALGLGRLDVVTAGMSSDGQPGLKLVGILEIKEFRNKVLEQRDKLSGVDNFVQNQMSEIPLEEQTTLNDIDNTLKRIEKLIQQKQK